MTPTGANSGPTGCSGKPLLSKIGVKPGHRVYLDNVPDTLMLEWPDDVVVVRRLPPAQRTSLDVAWTFCADRARLERRLEPIAQRLASNGMVWVSWPKKGSGVATDLDENVVRAIGLGAGLVDVKVAAVDETWSGLKFVYRLADRPTA